MDFSMEKIREILAAHRYYEATRANGRGEAAVSVVLRKGPESAEALFILRAEDPRDPWSGHVSFPGGRRDGEDASLLDTAVRDTREEVGLDLAAGGAADTLIGRLDDLPTLGRDRSTSLVVAQYVFELKNEKTELRPGPEAREAFWVPLAYLVDPQNASTLRYSRGAGELTLPCVRYEGKTIWGLTYMMLAGFFRVLSD